MAYKEDFAFVNTPSFLEGFVCYYNARLDESKEAFIDVRSLKQVVSKHLTEEPRFSLPRLVRINKMATGKPREVFVFPDEEQLLLKYLNYIINTLPLGIHPACFSFQRGIRITNAVRHIQSKNTQNMACIKIDISNYFNSIDTAQLNKWLPEVLLEKTYLTKVIAFLLHREEVIDGDAITPMKNRGVMAGMPLSPTLSNLYLRDFDRHMSEKHIAYARYSDDMVVFCPPDSAQHTLCEIDTYFRKLGLTLNAKKTKITAPGEAYEFLGLSIQGKSVDLSLGTIEKIKGKIKRQARSIYRWRQRKNVPLEKAVMVMNRKFNRKFYGIGADETDFTWSKYFFGVLTETIGLSTIDHYYQETIRFLATGKYTRSNYKKMPYKVLTEQGYIPLVSMYYKGGPSK